MSGSSGYRRMIFPVTFTAGVRQFPWLHYLKNSYQYRYYAYSLLVCWPIFYSIQKLSYSPANVEKARKMKERLDAEHHNRKLL